MKFVFFALFFAFVLSVVVSAGAPVKVYSCGNITQSNTTYLLMNDISMASDVYQCFNILASNVVFDCQGYSIIDNNAHYAVNGAGFVAKRLSNVEIKNCFIDLPDGLQGGAGVWLQDTSNSRILNNNFNNSMYGVLQQGGRDNVISGNIMNAHDAGGVYLSATTSTTVSKNTFERNVKAVALSGYATDNLIKDNVFNSDQYPISMYGGCSSNIFLDNTVNDAIYYAFYAKFDNKNNIVKGLTVNGGRDKGINLQGNSNSTFSDITIKDVQNYGVYMVYAINPQDTDNNKFVNLVVSGTKTGKDFFAGSNVDYTSLVNSNVKTYQFASPGAYAIFKKSDAGQVAFLKPIFGTGNDLTSVFTISNNKVTIDAREVMGMNQPSEITFYNMPGNFTNPAIYRNNQVCSNSKCKAMTSLNAGTVIIKVSSAGTYSIKER